MDEVGGVVDAFPDVMGQRILWSVKMTLNARINVLLHFYHYIDSFVFLKVARRGL